MTPLQRRIVKTRLELISDRVEQLDLEYKKSQQSTSVTKDLIEVFQNAIITVLAVLTLVSFSLVMCGFIDYVFRGVPVEVVVPVVQRGLMGVLGFGLFGVVVFKVKNGL